MSKKSTLRKVEKELERRLQRLAQGLPVTNTWSDKKVPTSSWIKVPWSRSGKRIVQIQCDCGQSYRIELLQHARKIFYRLMDQLKGRAKHKGIIERNLQKGDLTKAKFDEMIEGYFHEPTKPS